MLMIHCRLVFHHQYKSQFGEYAEKLVFINCFISRASLDAQMQQTQGPYTLIHRETGEKISLNQGEFDDLVAVHLFDHLEQVSRSQQWDYRRSEYDAMAMRLGGTAQKSYLRVFAGETEQA